MKCDLRLGRGLFASYDADVLNVVASEQFVIVKLDRTKVFVPDRFFTFARARFDAVRARRTIDVEEEYDVGYPSVLGDV